MNLKRPGQTGYGLILSVGFQISQIQARKSVLSGCFDDQCTFYLRHCLCHIFHGQPDPSLITSAPSPFLPEEFIETQIILEVCGSISLVKNNHCGGLANAELLHHPIFLHAVVIPLK